MSYRKILLYGRDFYKYMIQRIENALSNDFYKSFWFKENVLAYYDRKVETTKTLNLNDFNNKNYETAFNMNDFVNFFIDRLVFDKKFIALFEGKRITKRSLDKQLNLSKLVEANDNLPIFKLFKLIKQHVIIYFSYYIRDNMMKKPDKDIKYSIDFFIDEINNKYDARMNEVFFEWLHGQYQIYDYFLWRLEFLKNPTEDFYKSRSGIETDREKLHFNSDIKRSIYNNEIDDLYLNINKYDFVHKTIIKALNVFDSIYNISEVSLLRHTSLQENYISNYFSSELFGKFNPFGTNHFLKNNQILNRNNADLIEYYPDLEEIVLFEDSDITGEFIKEIEKNPTVKRIKVYYFGSKPIFDENWFSSKNFNSKIKITFEHIDVFFPELSPKAIKNIRDVSELKYELDLTNGFTIKNQIVYRIKYKNPNFYVSNNNLGGYVSSIYNLSQLQKCYITEDSTILDSSYVLNNAVISSGTVIKDNVIVADEVYISNSMISKNACIISKVKINNAYISDNAYVGGSTVLESFGNLYPKIKDDIKIEISKGYIRGNVVVSDSAKIQGSAYISNETLIEAEISGNSLINGNITIFGHPKVEDNAKLNGDIYMYDSSRVYGNAVLNGRVELHHESQIYDNAIVGQDWTNILVSGRSKVFQNAQILHNSQISLSSNIFGNCKINVETEFVNTRFYPDLEILNITKTSYSFKSLNFNNDWIKKMKRQPFFSSLVKDVELKPQNKSNQKYRITNWRKTVWDDKLKKSVVVYRIQANQDFSDVKRLEYGGYVESLSNLDEAGKAWVYDEAVVYGNAKVKDAAKIYNRAIVSDNSIVSQNAIVKDNVVVSGSSKVLGKVILSNNVDVNDFSIISAKTHIEDNVSISGNSLVFDDVTIQDNVKIFNSKITNGSIIKKTAHIKNSIVNNSYISGDVLLKHTMTNDARVLDSSFIKDSIIEKSSINDSSNISQSLIEKSNVFAKSIIQNSRLYRSVILDNSRVFDSLIKYTNANHFVDISSSVIFDSILNNFSQIKNSFLQNSITNDKVTLKEVIAKFSILNNSSNIVRSKVIFSIVSAETEILNSILKNTRVLETSYIVDSVVKDTKINDFAEIRNTVFTETNDDFLVKKGAK